MATILNDNEVKERKTQTQTPEVAVESDDSNTQQLFLHTVLHREAVTPAPDASSTNQLLNPPHQTPTSSSSHPTNQSGHSTPSRHLRNASGDTVPTTPGQPASPHIKAGGETTLEPVNEDPTSSNTESLPPAATSSVDQEELPLQPSGELPYRPKPTTATRDPPTQSETEPGTTSDSVHATRGSDRPARGRHTRPHRRVDLYWNSSVAGMGGQFIGGQYIGDNDDDDDGFDEPPVTAPEPVRDARDARRRQQRQQRADARDRNYHVVVDQPDRGSPQQAVAARDAELSALLHRLARLQALQTAVVCGAALVVVGVVLCRA